MANGHNSLDVRIFFVRVLILSNAIYTKRWILDFKKDWILDSKWKMTSMHKKKERIVCNAVRHWLPWTYKLFFILDDTQLPALYKDNK